MIMECIPEYQYAEEWAEISAKYNLAFEYNEFFNPLLLEDKNKLEEILHIYESLGRDTSKDTLHGAFLDITVSSSDPLIKKISDYRVRQSFDIASRLNVRGVVFHTNYLTDFKSKPYRDRWVHENTLYWQEICSEYGNLCVFIENMFDDTPELLCRLAENLTDSKNFGVCLDLAHAHLSKVSLSGWIDSLKKYIKHIHINDNYGEEDQHLAVGKGNIDWSILNNPDLTRNNPSILLEVSGKDKVLDSYQYLTGKNYTGIIPAEQTL